MNSNRWIATLVVYSAPTPTVTIMRGPRFLKLLLQRQAIAVREEWVNKTSFLACQRHNPSTQGTTCLGNTLTSKTQFKSCQKRSFCQSKKSGKIKQGQHRSQLTSLLHYGVPQWGILMGKLISTGFWVIWTEIKKKLRRKSEMIDVTGRISGLQCHFRGAWIRSMRPIQVVTSVSGNVIHPFFGDSMHSLSAWQKLLVEKVSLKYFTFDALCAL